MEIIEILKQLIRFKTTSNRSEDLSKIIDYVEEYFAKDFVVTRYERRKKHSLVVTYDESMSPEVFLVAHLDVVPGKEGQFEAVVKGNKLYARGSNDNKASAAIIMKLMKDLKEQKPSIGLMLTTDEEVGGMNGVKHLIEQGYSSKFAIVLDAGEDYNIITKEKAALHLKVKAIGKAAHGSKPWKGENAIDKLIDLYRELKESFSDSTKDDRWKNTISIGRIEGGTAVNKVADEAHLWIDMRFVSNKDKNKIKQLIEERGFEVKVLTDAGVMDTDPNNDYINRLKKCAGEVADKDIIFDKIHGATDARYFADNNIPAVMIMPNGGGTHADDEYVEIDSIDVIYKILKKFLLNY